VNAGISYKRLGCVVAIIFFAVTAMAQTKDTTAYSIHILSTGVINKTNDFRSYVLNNNFRFGLENKDYSINTAAGWIYGENQDRLTNNDVNTMADFNLRKTFPHFYYWGIATWERSVSLKLNHRFQGGLGIGYHIVDRRDTSFVISDGMLYESTGLYDTPDIGSDSTYSTYRNSFRAKFRIALNDVFKFDGFGFVQHSLSDRHDYVIKSQVNFYIKLIKWINFTTTLTYNKLSITGRENLLFTLGISADKIF
jgi:hypothetical protein